MYSEEEQRLYNKISRILVQHFLTRDYESIILTSKRVHSNKRQDHIMTKRKLLEQFAEMFAAWGLLLYYNMISTVSFPKYFLLKFMIFVTNKKRLQFTWEIFPFLLGHNFGELFFVAFQLLLIYSTPTKFYGISFDYRKQ